MHSPTSSSLLPRLARAARRLAALAPALAALLALAPARPAAAAPVDLSAEEFKLWKDYQGARTDERVLKMPEKKRFAEIAKNFHVKEKALQAALDKGDKAGAADAVKLSEAELKAALDAGPLKGRGREIRLDDAVSEHVVTYVSWTNKDEAKLDAEACYAALAAAKSVPFGTTVAVWAVNEAGVKVFEAKITAEAAGRFNAEHVPMFATRYIKTFEDVKKGPAAAMGGSGSN